MGSKIAHPHSLLQERGPSAVYRKSWSKVTFVSLCVKACFSSSRFIFRHLESWKRLMLCHRTGLKKLLTIPVKNSAAGWNCGSLLRYAVWNPVVRIFRVCCAAVRSWRYDRRVIGDRNGFFRQSCLDRKPPGILHIFKNIFLSTLRNHVLDVLVGSRAEFCERRVSLVVLWPYVTREHVFIAQVQGAENQFLSIPISSHC